MLDLIARATTEIEALPDAVWQALVDPDAIKQYMFGTTVTSEWRQGAPIQWKGEWKGKAYEDKGVILTFDPGRRLRYSHFIWHLFVLLGSSCHFLAILSCCRT